MLEEKQSKAAKKGVSFIKDKKKEKSEAPSKKTTPVAPVVAAADSAQVEALKDNMEQVKSTMLTIS